MTSFTGLVVVYNEEDHLDACLKSLRFCDEVLVVDLGSSDRSVEVAQQNGARLLTHEWVSYVEAVWPDVVPKAVNEWIVRLDPDETFPEGLVSLLRTFIDQNPRLAAVGIPYRNLYKGEPLKTTVWGGLNHKFNLVFHRDRVITEAVAHRGISPKDGYESRVLPSDGTSYVEHHWVDSFSELVRKHMRNMQFEGPALYRLGNRFSWGNWIKWTAAAFKESWIDKSGWREGARGFFLSAFRAWYVNLTMLSLRRYERTLDR